MNNDKISTVDINLVDNQGNNIATPEISQETINSLQQETVDIDIPVPSENTEGMNTDMLDIPTPEELSASASTPDVPVPNETDVTAPNIDIGSLDIPLPDEPVYDNFGGSLHHEYAKDTAIQNSIVEPATEAIKKANAVFSLLQKGNPVNQAILESGKEITSFGYGIANFVKNVATGNGLKWEEFSQDTDKWIDKNFGIMSDDDYQKMNGTLASLTKEITQFGIGYYTGGQILKGAKLLQGTGNLTKLAKPEVQSFIGDLIAFDPHDSRFGNFLQQFPSLEDTFLTYTASDENDTDAEGRFKNAIEGLGLGAVIGLPEFMLSTAKATKAMLKAETKDAFEEALMNYSKDIDELTVAEAKGANPKVQTEISEASVEAEAKSAPPKNLIDESQAKPVVAEEVPTVSVKDFAKIIDNASTAETAVKEITSTGNFKHLVFNSPQGSHVLKEIGESISHKTLKAQGVEHQADVVRRAVEEAKDLGNDFTEVVGMLKDSPRAIAEVVNNFEIQRAMLHQLTEFSLDLAKKQKLGTATQKDLYDFVKTSKYVQDLTESVANARTSLGRALASGKVTMNRKTAKQILDSSYEEFNKRWKNVDNINTEKEAEDWLANNGYDRDTLARQAEAIIMSDGNLVALKKAVEAPKLTRLQYTNKALSEMFINNILSGYTTQFVNVTTGLLKLLDEPFGKMIGGMGQGVWRTIKKGGEFDKMDYDLFLEGKTQLFGYFHFINEALQFGAKSFKLDSPVLLKNASPDGVITNRVISKDALENSDWVSGEINPTVGNIIDWIGTALNLPSRCLMTTDEVIKQLSYRSSVRASLFSEGMRKGLSGDNLSNYIESNFKRFIDKDGVAEVTEETVKQRQIAMEATWSQPIDGLAKSLHDTTRKAGIIGDIILPFVKTPTNILSDAYAHAPLSLLTNAIKQNGKNADPKTYGKIALGVMTYGFAGMLYSQGMITGSAPTNKKEREYWKASGYEEYSIKVGNRWVSYRKLDPIGTILGLATDILTLVDRDNTFYSEEQNLSFVAKSLGSMFTNITSKSYFTGLQNIAEITTDPTSYKAQNIMYNTTTSFMPFSSLLRNIRKEIDPVSRYTESLGDYFKNTIPFLSRDLPARINFITGKPIVNSNFPEYRNDPVFNELSNIGDKIYGAPLPTINGIKLTKAQYSRYLELTGTVKDPQGKTLYETLKEVFSDPEYQKLDYASYGDYDGVDPKAKVVNDIIRAYREEAQSALFDEDKEFANATLRREAGKYLTKRGELSKDMTYEQSENAITDFLKSMGY